MQVRVFPPPPIYYLHEKIVSTGHRFHDVPLDLLVLQYGKPIVYENRRMCGLKVGAKIWRRFLHAHCRHLQQGRAPPRGEIK